MLVLVASAFAGCSESRELRTSGQAAGFAVEIAGGESPLNWELAAKPTVEAAQAWSARAQLSDLGSRLQNEGATWACEFARKSIGLGSIGSFNQNDVGIETREGSEKGVAPDRVSAMLHDIVSIRYREFVLVTTSICGPNRS